MDILAIPFHKYLHLEKHDGNDYIFKASERLEYLNHLGTIHACVQLALAEASSGEFLWQEFTEVNTGVIPVIRRTEARYHRPANGSLYAKAGFLSSSRAEILKDLQDKGRSLTRIKVEIHDKNKSKVLTAVFDWFLKMK